MAGRIWWCFVFIILQIVFLANGLCQEKDTLQKKEEESEQDTSFSWYRYFPNIYTLRGVLIEVETFGPPYYGEDTSSSQKVYYYAVKLDTPINVLGEDSDDFINTETEEGMKILQLRFVDIIPFRKLEKMIHKSINVRGQLFHSMMGGDYTKVLIEVLDIDLVEKELKKSQSIIFFSQLVGVVFRALSIIFQVGHFIDNQVGSGTPSQWTHERQPFSAMTKGDCS